MPGHGRRGGSKDERRGAAATRGGRRSRGVLRPSARSGGRAHGLGEPARRDTFFAHWARILADETVVARTIVADGEVAGNVVVWTRDGRRLVGYWIGRAHWGRGIATEAVRRLVDEVTERPLYAFVATDNVGSLRVLEKCGFAIPPGDVPPARGGDDVEEVPVRLDR